MFYEKFFKTVVGKWSGNCRTWFEPGQLADESKISGEILNVFGGRFVRHVYVGSMQGKPRHGEDLLAYNKTTNLFQSCWIDDFHMSTALLISEGKATERGFSVLGAYDVGENIPRWGWRTEFELIDDNHLKITAYNIEPAAEETKAVEVTYERVT